VGERDYIPHEEVGRVKDTRRKVPYPGPYLLEYSKR
jgi:hypothetical protein